MLQEVLIALHRRPAARAFNGSTRVSLAGSSSPTLCRGLVSQLFRSVLLPLLRCSFSGRLPAPCGGKFIVSPEDRRGGPCPEVPGVWSQCAGTFQAFSAFFYTMDFLRTVMGLPVATLQQLEVAVVTVYLRHG